MWRDLERTCAEYKLEFRRPTPFPQPSVLAARVALVGLDQSLDASLSESIRPWGKDFCLAVFHAEFADGMRIDAPETIRLILSNLNVDAEAAIARAQTDAIKDRLRSQTAQARELGIFGAPTFITTDGELFWGNDRMESAIAWARRTA
jgi:2-hydroxychromene-2-carboxylate isomerase